MSGGLRHLFLLGNYRPVADEVDLADLRIEGDWPAGLQGTLVQAGPNPAFAPERSYHPFEGSGMLHALHIDAHGASYRNRFVRTPDYLLERAAGRNLASPLADPPTEEALASGRFPYRDAANTALVSHGGAAWALNDFHPPIRVDPRSLETLGRDPVLGGELAPFTAHPKRDPETGELVYFRTHLAPELTLGTLDDRGVGKLEARVPLLHPRLMHDFAVSRNWVVFFDTGVAFDETRARAGGSGWWFDPSLPARLIAVPRDGGALRTFELEPCVIMHVLNAWESNDTRFVHVFAVRYPSLPDALAVDAEPSGAAPARSVPDANSGRLWRWTLDLRDGTVHAACVSKTAAEFPRQDDSLLMRPTRRAWLTANPPLGALVEIDLELGRERVVPHGRGRYASEFVFVPEPGAAPERGYLLAYVWNAALGTSEVVALDSERPEQGPIARVHIPRRVPFGFHLTWFPDFLGLCSG